MEQPEETVKTPEMQEQARQIFNAAQRDAIRMKFCIEMAKSVLSDSKVYEKFPTPVTNSDLITVATTFYEQGVGGRNFSIDEMNKIMENMFRRLQAENNMRRPAMRKRR